MRGRVRGLTSRCAMLIISSIPAGIVLIRTVLGGRNCALLAASDKTGTLHVTRRERPGLVLLSVVVPRVSKCRMLRRLGDGPRAGGVPIVVVSTLDSVRDVMGNCRLKTARCMAGPFRQRRLIGHITRHCRLFDVGHVGRRLRGAVRSHSALCSIVTRSLHSPLNSLGVVGGTVLVVISGGRIDSRMCRVLRVVGGASRRVFRLLSGLLG